MDLPLKKADNFREIVWQHYRLHGRKMPWRDEPAPYYVLVSEIMLQQTQVARVIPKFNQFIARFPDIESLARASLAEVLDGWSGLGYNRRAKFLHQTAQRIVADYSGTIPSSLAQLVSLPGVGTNTAGAVMAYAFGMPAVFVETNIRTVYIHHFFEGQADISDRDILELVEATIDHERPREWYWALMDYGAALKARGERRLDTSRHYKKQSAFNGSLRQMRGLILRQLRAGSIREDILRRAHFDARFEPAIEGLLKDGLIERTNGLIGLTGAGVAPHNG